MQPFSDANRLAAVFRTIDTWVEPEDPNFHLITAMSANREKDGTFVGLDVSKEFCLILFGYKEKLYQQKDAQIALLAEHSKASDVYHQFKFMVSHLEAGGGSKLIRTFIQEIKPDINYWQVAEEEEVYSLVIISFLHDYLIVSATLSMLGTHSGMFLISTLKLTATPTPSKDKLTFFSLLSLRRSWHRLHSR